MTIFLTSLPTKEPGRLEPREDPTKRSDKDNVPLQPAMDFYKRIALDCNDKQIAVDLFVLNSQYVDLASICKCLVLKRTFVSFRAEFNSGVVFNFIQSS